MTNLQNLWLDHNNLTGPLPPEFVNLANLTFLNIRFNAGLCAPADAAFQAWLATIAEFRGDTCADAVPAAPRLALMLLAMLLLGGGAYYHDRHQPA